MGKEKIGLVENNISKQDNLSKILEEYYLNPMVLLSKINH
jgi:hypothetical protein